MTTFRPGQSTYGTGFIIITRRGADVPSSKLTVEQVKEIRASKKPNRYFAKRFGVTVDGVRKARVGITWGHVA
jgi:hypothetical protein